MKRIVAGLFFVLISLIPMIKAYSQEIQLVDKVYDENIFSVLLYADGDQLQLPAIELGSDEQLKFSFDDLSNQSYSFKYTFIHCTADWQVSDLNQMDYLEGYFEGEISHYKFSFNTRTPYIHYQLSFPNDEIRPKLSGNYILKVYLDDGATPQPIITRRFYVYESGANVSASLSTRPKNIAYLKKKQEIEIQASLSPDLIDEAAQRVVVNVWQNGRCDNALMGLHSSSVSGSVLYFDFPDGLVFDGGNEPRFFDIKSYRYLSQSVERIIPESQYYEVFLHPDFPRNGMPYETYQNIQGRKLITARNDQDASVEGDYAEVHFSLRMNKLEHASVFVMGALTDWRLSPSAKMTYNLQKKAYTLSMFLKQGYYEYWYVVLPDNQTKADIVKVEGDHWETNNQYTIFTYYHNRTPEYDKLINVKQFVAHQK